MHRNDELHPLAIKLWYPPLVAVTQLSYIGQDGQSRNLVAGTDFQFDPASEPGIIQPLPGEVWPLTLRHAKSAVQIFYIAGYETRSDDRIAGEAEDANVHEPESLTVDAIDPPRQVITYELDLTIPEPLVLAVKQLVLHWYQNRDLVIAQPGAGGKFTPLPQHVLELIEDFVSKDLSITYYPRQIQTEVNEEEPVTVDSAKDFCRITSSDDDTFVATLIRSARIHIEKNTWRSLIKKSFVQSLDGFPRHSRRYW